MRGLVIASVLAVTHVSAAEPANPASPGTDPATDAGASFQRGRELARLGRFDAACVEFARSYELDPALGTAVNLADCLERQGKLYRAWELFDRVARNSQTVQSRARLARQRADALEARYARIVVTLRDPSVPGLAVRIGDRQVAPAAEIRDLIEPRDVEIVAAVPGRPAFRTVLHAAAGAIAQVDVPGFAAPPEAVAAPSRRRRSRVYLADAIAGTGTVGLGISLGLAISAKRQYNAAIDGDCAAGRTAPCRQHVEQAGHRADLATGFVIGGAVLVAAAAAVYFTAPRDIVGVAPIATGREIGLGVVGRF
jgi:tetratricopeptide (TPR) repeat protein